MSNLQKEREMVYCRKHQNDPRNETEDMLGILKLLDFFILYKLNELAGGVGGGGGY